MPSLTAMVTESRAPISVTKRMALSLNPNQTRASGSQQMDGSVCNPSAPAPTVRLKKLTVPLKNPRTVPVTSATPNASPSRPRLILTASGSDPSLKPSTSARQTSDGPGNRYGLHHSRLNPVSHNPSIRIKNSPGDAARAARPASFNKVRLLLHYLCDLISQVRQDDLRDLGRLRGLQ
jgi:hypothetical protein